MGDDSLCRHDPPVFGLPSEERLAVEAGHGGNQLYTDLRRRFNWGNIDPIIELDRGLVRRLREWDDPHTVRRTILWYLAECVGMTMERYEDSLFDSSPFSYLDPGVASTVVTLAAHGAIPITSCNGGVFGDDHFHSMPLVAFYAGRQQSSAILQAALQVGLSLEQNGATQSPMLWHPKIEPFLAFAQILREQATH